jgi:predicted RNase H-like HicB family nuclease
LPGCAADGASYLETPANLEQVIDEWIGTARELGRTIPDPPQRAAAIRTGEGSVNPLGVFIRLLPLVS